MHRTGARFDHRFHQFKGVQHAAETSFRIRNNGQEIIGITGIPRTNAVRPLNLIGAAEGVIDTLHHRRHGVSRIQ